MGKIQNKLIMYALVLSLCSIGILGAIIQFYCLDIIEEAAMDKAIIEAKSSATNMDHWILDIKQDLSRIAEGLEMQNSSESEDISQYLIEKEEENGFRYQLGLEDNRVISSSNNSIKNDFNTLETIWYKEAIDAKESVISEPYVEERTEDVTITVSQSLSIDGIQGVLAVNVPISSLLQELNLVKGNETALETNESQTNVDVTSGSTDVISVTSETNDSQGNTDATSSSTDAISAATASENNEPQKVENSGYTFMIDNDGKILSHKSVTYRPNADGFHSIEAIIEKELEKYSSSENTLEEKRIIDYDGIEKIFLIEPASEVDWSAAVVVPVDLVMDARNTVQQIGLIVIIGLILFSVVLSIIVSNSIAKPITNIAALSENISNRDFRDEISDIKKNKKGEIGSLYRALDAITVKLSNFMKDVLDSVNTNKEVNHSVVGNFNELLENTEETSEATEELSANMEETSLSITSISETTKEIDTAVDELTRRIEQGAQTANEISVKALEMDERFTQAKNDTMSILDVTKAEIGQSIEAVKEVEKIDLLIETILGIAAQTNLLSLNASIEAARAGELGRGFTIVANEIRELANNSDASAIEIQIVTENIKGTVDNLVQSTDKLMQFLENDIVEDYETMLNTVDHYKKDGIALNDLLIELTGVSEELGASIETVTSSIREISISISQTTTATSDIADKNTSIVKIVNEVEEILNKNMEVANKLNELLNKVKFS